jgi:3-deoxy-manno-octulosonate cytidylyltransferase (CMP-KDO synthetase)
MDFRVIIPVRFESARLPGKPLLDIAGKPMIQHVYERAKESGAESVVIATDSDEVAAVAEGFGAKVCMTLPEHQSGTERLSEAVEALEYDDDEIIVNVQGDEPLINPDLISQVARDLSEHETVKVASICQPIKSVEDLMSSHVVKVVLNRRSFAMYFSRSPIPWQLGLKDKGEIDLTENYFSHVGIYAYRVSVLKDYINWTESPYEALESLEQLRVLWNGHKIHMSVSGKKLAHGVDTQDDLDRVREILG